MTCFILGSIAGFIVSHPLDHESARPIGWVLLAINLALIAVLAVWIRKLGKREVRPKG